MYKVIYNRGSGEETWEHFLWDSTGTLFCGTHLVGQWDTFCGTVDTFYGTVGHFLLFCGILFVGQWDTFLSHCPSGTVGHIKVFSISKFDLYT